MHVQRLNYISKDSHKKHESEKKLFPTQGTHFNSIALSLTLLKHKRYWLWNSFKLKEVIKTATETCIDKGLIKSCFLEQVVFQNKWMSFRYLSKLLAEGCISVATLTLYGLIYASVVDKVQYCESSCIRRQHRCSGIPLERNNMRGCLPINLMQIAALKCRNKSVLEYFEIIKKYDEDIDETLSGFDKHAKRQ